MSETQTMRPWSLTHEVRLLGDDFDNLQESCFQLGRLWREHIDGTGYPVDMHDPSGPCDRETSEEVGEDATYWHFVDAMADLSPARRVFEIVRAARYVCARLSQIDFERATEWHEHEAEIRRLLPLVVDPAEIEAAILRGQAAFDRATRAASEMLRETVEMMQTMTTEEETQ